MILDNWIRRCFRAGEPVNHFCNPEENNIIRRVLAEIQGLGCRVEKTRNGRGWMIVVDGSTDVPYPPGYAAPWSGSAGAYPFEILYQDSSYIRVRDGLWETISADDRLLQFSIDSVSGSSYQGDPNGVKEDLAPVGGWGASKNYIVYALMECVNNNIAGDYIQYALSIVIQEDPAVFLPSPAVGPDLAETDASRSRYKILGRISTNSLSEPLAGSIVQLHRGGNIGLDNIAQNQFRLLVNGNGHLVVTGGSWTYWHREWVPGSSVWKETAYTVYPENGAEITWLTTGSNNETDLRYSNAYDVATAWGTTQVKTLWLKMDRSSSPVVLTLEFLTSTPGTPAAENVMWRKLGNVSLIMPSGTVYVTQEKSGSVETYSHHPLPSSFDTAIRPNGVDAERWRAGDGAGLKLTIPSLQLVSGQVDLVEFELWFDTDGHLIAVPEVIAGDITEDALSYLDLKDTPATFGSAGGHYAKVNSGETAIEFVATTDSADGSGGAHTHE